MIPVGIAIFVFGYVTFYWGLHHLIRPRYSFWTLLGIPKSWNMPMGTPVSLNPPKLPPPPPPSSGSASAGGSGKVPSSNQNMTCSMWQNTMAKLGITGCNCPKMLGGPGGGACPCPKALGGPGPCPPTQGAPKGRAI